ncbi:hypothetical protein ACIG54_33390 [Streptomyces achromogenes]|uniref:hypothetical protein n=1 Tax=Streptomyces achromogenes TaxID=67255 RepID=UPI0034427AEF
MLAGRAEHAYGLRRVAKVFGRIGKPSAAAEPAQGILGLASTADSPSRRRWDTYAAADALLAAGDAGTGDSARAAALLEEISHPARREAATPSVVKPLPAGAPHTGRGTVLGPVGAVIEEIAAVAPEHLPALTPTLEAAGLGRSGAYQ